MYQLWSQYSGAFGHRKLFHLGDPHAIFSGRSIDFATYRDIPSPGLPVVISFSTANVKLAGQAFSLMTSKMGDAAMDLADGAETVKELWSCLCLQYHDKGRSVRQRASVRR